MVRSLVATAALAGALLATAPASAQDIRVGVGAQPGFGASHYYTPGYGSSYGYYPPTYGHRYERPTFFDQRYYGDWRDYRGKYVYPHYHYHGYPYPHYHLHWHRGYPPQHGGHQHYVQPLYR